MRIRHHPIIDFHRGKEVKFNFNGREMKGFERESIASALHASGIKVLSHSIKYARPRGFFCGIGKCSSCLMRVDGIPNVRTCIVPIKEGMEVRAQDGIGELSSAEFLDKEKKSAETQIAIVGGGPAGLSAGIQAAGMGADVIIIDENPRMGGQLVKQTHRFFGSKEQKAGMRGIDIGGDMAKKITELEKKEKVEAINGFTVIGYYNNENHLLVAAKEETNELMEIRCKKIIFACGARENMLAFPDNDLPGVYGAGGVQTLMNLYGIKPGKKVLMVGAGNVGLIVSYQLLQAGVKVIAVVEAMPKIGGYHVHAAKLRRCGIPIYTSCSIKKIYGNGKVEGAIIAELDEKWNPIKGTEKDIECDSVCLAVGLTPSIELLFQTRAKMEFVPEAGGWVALHDESMETTTRDIYVAGDLSGIEEATTAMIEGKIAGISAAGSLGYEIDEEKLKKAYRELEIFRRGLFGEIPRKGKEKILELMKNEKL